MDLATAQLEQLVVTAERRGGRWSVDEVEADLRLRAVVGLETAGAIHIPSLSGLAKAWGWTVRQVRWVIEGRSKRLSSSFRDAASDPSWSAAMSDRTKRCGLEARRAALLQAQDPESDKDGKGEPSQSEQEPKARPSTGRRKPRPARPKREAPPVDDYGRVTSDAVRRWWMSYGRDWTAVRTLMLRGWDELDVFQEVLLSSVTKSQGKSRWDPSRSNVDAWAGLVGRSRVLHLLERRQDLQPLAHDHSYLRDGEAARMEDELTEPVEWGLAAPPPKPKTAPQEPAARPARPLVVRRRQGG